MLEGKPRPGAPEAGHHFICDVENAVLVAQCANSGEVARWWHHDAGRAWDGLQDDGRNCGRTFGFNGALEMLQGAGALLGFGRGMKFTAVEKGSKEVNNSGASGIGRPSAGVTGEVDGGRGGAVVAAVGGEDLGSPGVESSHTYGVLHGFGTTVGKEDLGRTFERTIQNHLGCFVP